MKTEKEIKAMLKFYRKAYRKILVAESIIGGTLGGRYKSHIKSLEWVLDKEKVKK